MYESFIQNDDEFGEAALVEIIHLPIQERRFDLWVRKTPGVGNGTPLQYFCLENSMGSGAWKATVHRAAKS